MCGLDAKLMSWVFITSLATSGDETTMEETSPSLKCIRGPCFLAKSLSPRWDREPDKTRWCMFPMIGSFHGPGGNFDGVDEFLVLVLFDMFSTMNTKSKKVKRIGNEGNWNSMIKVSNLDWSFCYSLHVYIYVYIYMYILFLFLFFMKDSIFQYCAAFGWYYICLR